MEYTNEQFETVAKMVKEAEMMNEKFDDSDFN